MAAWIEWAPLIVGLISASIVLCTVAHLIRIVIQATWLYFRAKPNDQLGYPG